MSDTKKRASLSGLEIRVLVKELGALTGGYVSDIHSLGESQVFRIKKASGEDSSLLVSPRYGTWVMQRPAQTATDPFTTLLRQRLTRLKLVAVEQVDLDRVVVFHFSNDEEVRMILELRPPGNIVLTDSKGVITLALRDERSTQRTILKGKSYEPPPQSRMSLERTDEKLLGELLSAEKTVGKALGRGLSLPRRYVEEILSRASLTQGDPTPVPQETVRRLSSVIGELVTGLDAPVPSLVRTADGIEVMAVQPVRAEVIERASSMSLLVDNVFSPLLLQDESQQQADENSEAKELEVTLGRLRSQATAASQRAAALREIAILAREASSSDELERVMLSGAVDKPFRERHKGEGPPAVASALFDEAKAAEAEVRRIRQVELGLGPRLNRAKKTQPKATVKIVSRQAKEWYEKFRWFFTTGGKLAVGGRDAQTNSILVKKHLEEGDVAYHADLFGSPFFVLKGGEGQTEDEVRQVAQATVAFSSAWKTGLAAADAYWVRPDQVSTSAPSGEFLSRGSFAIRGKKNFVTKNPVEIAVGLDSKGRVVAAPEETLITLSGAHVTLVPSREKSSDTAKKVLFELRKLYGGELVGAGVDDVLRVLPTGGGKIVRRRENHPVPAETKAGDQAPDLPGPSD